jgi:sialate O-acetylesterase
LPARLLTNPQLPYFFVMRKRFLLLLALSLLACVASAADLRLSPLFGDGMVLQRDDTIRIFGDATAGKQVQASLAGKSAEAVADAKGHWRISLDPLPAGGPHRIEVSSGGETLTISDVLIGDVWVASGQSNMEWSVDQIDASGKVQPNNKIRLFSVPRAAHVEPRTEVGAAQWKACNPEEAGDFSVVAYFFASEIQRETGIPIGVIDTSIGGTSLQQWMPRDCYGQFAESKEFLAKQVTEEERAAWDLFAKERAAWQEKMRAATAEGRKDRTLIKSEPKPPGEKGAPTVCYNGMIAPITGMTIKGVIWYQGEHNTGIFGSKSPEGYESLFSAMIKCWREAWGQGDFPFLFVQLPNFGKELSDDPMPKRARWAQVRESQRRTALMVPNTAMVTIIDVGGSLHPQNKEPVGHRLALAALGTVYGQKIVYSGPRIESVDIKEGVATARFTHVGGGLMARGDGALEGFAVAGEDGQFQKADAKIAGETVVVTSPHISRIAAVRYAWHDNPKANLFNKEGLPASPFTTQDQTGQKPLKEANQ